MAANADKEKLPLAHPTTITWIALSTALVVVALYIFWLLFMAGPSIMR